jgi:cytochrome c oxidase accessory protein FixG
MNKLNLVSLGSINEDGSKKTLHPADVAGKFTRGRRIVALLILIVYVSLPWIQVNGFPAVFLDVLNRRFHFMGLTLAVQDLWVGFFLVTGLGFSLFYVTALFGRVWCGWTCPYTVFLEHVYRRIERWIDGDAAAPSARRRTLDAAKITRRVIKHTIFIVISLLIAHIFLSYFVSIKGLYEMMHHSPKHHFMAFGVVLFLTAGLYGAFSWFREQFCVIMCPYGRLQSALSDDTPSSSATTKNAASHAAKQAPLARATASTARAASRSAPPASTSATASSLSASAALPASMPATPS